MTLPEQFLEDTPDVSDRPFEVFRRYNLWLTKQFQNCKTQEGKKLLQKEADRFTQIYLRDMRDLFTSPKNAENI